MATALSRWLGMVGQRVISETDTADQRLNKTLLIFACGLMSFAAMLWLAIYWAMGIKFSVTVPFSYLAISTATLVFYIWNRNFEVFRFAQVSLYLFVPFIMQWSIGSYVTSSGVMLWALLAPIGVMIFQGARESIPWFVAYIVMTAVSGAFDYYLSYGRQAGVPLNTIGVFFALNFAAMSTIVYLLFNYFVREKERLKQQVDERNRLLSEEQRKSEALLLNILPQSIAERLKQESGAIADGHDDVTVMFADIVDFTRLAEELPPRHIIRLLNTVFSEFDRLTEKYGLEKIKTVGDAYMVAGGLTGNSLDYTHAIAQMALEARAYMATHTSLQSRRLELHIGISTGPVVAGVIGVKRFIYDVWGNTVNIASRLASEAMANSVLVDVATYQRLHSQFDFEGPEALAVKGKRQLICYRLEPQSAVKQSTVVRPVQLRS